MTYFIGWTIILVSYFLTLALSLAVGGFLFPSQEPLGENSYRVIEENRLYLKYFVTAMMVIVPYVLAGIYARKQRDRREVETALWISVIPVAAERILVFILGLYFAPTFLSGWNINSVVPFIQWKTPALYFSYTYMVLGLLSILITITISKIKFKKGT